MIAAALAVFLCALHDARAASPEEIIFAAWNVRNYRLEPSRTESGSTPAKSPQSVAAVVATLRAIGPDIVGLCEIGTRKDLADLQRRLARAGLPLTHSTWVDGPDQERHIALLSRFPLGELNHDTRTGFRLGGVTHRIQRGILDCTAEVRPDFRLRILGVHLKSPRIVPEFDQAEFRRAESLILRRRVESILREDPATPLLVFGDFNDTKDSPVVKGVLGRSGTPASLTALAIADRQGDQWTYRWDESDEYTRIDYVMVSGFLRSRVLRRTTRIHRDKNWYDASDHRPLVVGLRLPKSPKR